MATYPEPSRYVNTYAHATINSFSEIASPQSEWVPRSHCYGIVVSYGSLLVRAEEKNLDLGVLPKKTEKDNPPLSFYVEQRKIRAAKQDVINLASVRGGPNRNLSSVFVDNGKSEGYCVCFYFVVNDTPPLRMPSAEAVKKLQQVLGVSDEPRWCKIAD